MASLATVGTGKDGAGWAYSIALVAVLINHLKCAECGNSNSPSCHNYFREGRRWREMVRLFLDSKNI